MHKKLQIITVAALLFMGTNVSAEPGDGLQTGNLKLSPGISLFGGFNSNVFFSADDETGFSAPTLRVQPFFDVSTIQPDAFDFGFNGKVAWQQYLDSNDVVSDQSGLDANVGLHLTLNPNGAFSFRVEDSFERTNEPPYDPTSTSYDRTLNRVGATIGIHPGGRVFEHYLSYDWSLQLHDTTESVDRQIHDFTLRNYWKFLPRTAFVLTGDVQIVDYNDESRPVGGQNFANVESTPLRITGGLTGLITSRLALNLVGGWGFGFYADDPSFSGFLADVSLKYYFGSSAEKSNVYVGYEREFIDSTIGNFKSWHRPYLGFEQGIANRRLMLDVRADFLVRTYEGTFEGVHNVASGQLIVPPDIDDNLLRIRAGVTFNLTRWLSTGVNYSLAANFTDDVVTSSVGTAGDALRRYTQHNVGLQLTAKY